MNGLEPADWELLVKRLVEDDQFYEKVHYSKHFKI